jgi:chromosome segregation ATPase
MNTIEKVIVGVAIAAGGLVGYKIGGWEVDRLRHDLDALQETARTADAEQKKTGERISAIQAEAASAVKARETALRQEFETQKKGLDDLIAKGQQRIADLDRKQASAQGALARTQKDLETATGDRREQLLKREARIKELEQRVQDQRDAIACEAKPVPAPELAKLNAVGGRR